MKFSNILPYQTNHGIKMSNQKTKDQIMLEATTLFCQNSFNKVTIKDISIKAGCNIAAINYHFKNKKQLYFDIFEKAYSEATASFDEETHKLTALEKIDAFIDRRLESALSPFAQHNFYRLINQEVQDPSPVNQLVASKYLKPMLERLKLIVRDFLGQNASELQIHTTVFSIKSHCVGMHITMAQNKTFWPPQDRSVIKNEIKQFIINAIIDYKKQIGNPK